MKLSNWGNYPITEAEVKKFSSEREALKETKAWKEYIVRGLGRCYGDSALADKVLSTENFNRFLNFDAEKGLLTCQAGVSFEEILKVVVPKGWFVPVTPGTKFITLGGAIAADVHGKNHHSEGSFSRHMLSLKLMAGDGNIYDCSPEENADVFWATCGGMGLTGLILEATFQLKPIETVYIKEESIRVRNLEELFPLFEKAMDYTYSVAWIDCLATGNNLGRGILLNGEHAKLSDLKDEEQLKNPLGLPTKGKLAVPFEMPSFTINPLTTKVFNEVFYSKGNKDNFTHITDYDTYFYPLDGIHHWNRVYGKKGMVQYQFVIPPEGAYDGLVRILEKISEHKLPSFLTVLKYFGGGDKGLMSFPMEGYTLALDFPVTDRVFPILDELDEVILELGGRIYLTKDARMKAEVFSQGYPKLGEFRKIKERLDPQRMFQSMQSKRLGL